MSATDSPSREAVNEEAALWHARLDSGSADQAEFEAWRDANPRHSAAFARISATAMAMDDLRGAESANDPDLKPVPKIDRRRFVSLAAAVAVLAVGGGLGVGLTRRASASTVVGGRKSIVLPDGSRLELNTDSKASWKFDGQRRRIWLDRGEIALTVPADSRPCLLFAGNRVILVQAAEINARLRSSAVDLTVLKGKCTMFPAAGKVGSQGPVSLQPGEAALAGRDETRVRAVTTDDLAFSSGWRQGELVFEGQTLGVAVSEYNRYLPGKIVIADPKLEGVRLGGRFNTHDPKDFLASLHTSFGINSDRASDGSILLSR